MTWISDALAYLAGLPQPLVLAVAGLLAFSETAIGFGFVIPGETGVLVMATTVTSTPMFLLMSLVVWLSASAGDSFGYWIGRRYGVRMRDTKLVARVGRDRWDRTAALLRRRGFAAVVVARFVPAVRILTPVAAGSFRMSYPRFLTASLIGALGWATAHVAIGAFAGASLPYLERAIGTGGWVLLGVLVAVTVAVVLWRRRRRRAEPAPENAPEADVPATR